MLYFLAVNEDDAGYSSPTPPTEPWELHAQVILGVRCSERRTQVLNCLASSLSLKTYHGFHMTILKTWAQTRNTSCTPTKTCAYVCISYFSIAVFKHRDQCSLLKEESISGLQFNSDNSSRWQSRGSR